MFSNGIQYVNWPKLIKVRFLDIEQNIDKEKQFNGLHYLPSAKFSKPGVFKRDW